MITCAKCGKDNQDHYKFCLGCGTELSKDSRAPKPFSPQTPPQGVPAQAAAAQGTEAAPTPIAGSPLPAAAAAAPVANAAPAQAAAGSAAAAGTVECPQCGHTNSTGNRFCASCGYNLGSLAANASSSAPPAAVPSGGAVSLTALRADGTEAGNWPMPNEPKTVVGRDTGSVFAGDSYLSPKHASFSRSGDQVSVRDEGSLNGVYLKLKPQTPWPLNFGDICRIGQEIIRIEPLESQPPSGDGVERLGSPKDGYVARLALVIGRDTTGNSFPVPHTGVHCGRERGDILFSEDGYVSGLHCQIAPGDDGRLYLTDIGSSNGTFVRLSSEYAMENGDILLMGQQLFRVDVHQ